MENKKYYVKIPEIQHLVEVDEEVYREYYRPVWREHDRAKRNGTCGCNNWRLCSGDCGLCSFRRGGNMMSFDQMREVLGDAAESVDKESSAAMDKDNPFRRIDRLFPGEDSYERVLDQMMNDSIVERLKALPEEERRICECILMDLTEREGAERLGISKTTYHDKKERLFKRLRTEWSDLK